MEGPYRDLGGGFARLTGVEGARRGPSRISHVEDALTELLRNARDAGARNVFVASSLTRRRFRTLTVIDDGRGIPRSYAELVFEPGVTTRHLDPVRDPVRDLARGATPHGAGLSLYHIREAALSAEVVSTSDPTAIRVTFDTLAVPERTLQSATRPSNTNLRATLEHFARSPSHENGIQAYYGAPAAVLSTLLRNRIIRTDLGPDALKGESGRVGIGVSLRTAQRVSRGQVEPLTPVAPAVAGGGSLAGRRPAGGGGPVLALGEKETAGIADILRRAARSGYLEVEDLRVQSRPGEISLTARVYEPEDEYE